jgi:hypothetical protein
MNFKITSSSAWQIQKLRETNALYASLRKNIKTALKNGSYEVSMAFNEAVTISNALDNKIFKVKGSLGVKAFKAVIEAGYAKTMGTLTNMSNTAGSGFNPLKSASGVIIIINRLFR